MSPKMASVTQQSRQRVPKPWTEYRECPKASYFLCWPLCVTLHCRWL